ncbi:MAG: phosphatidylinositol-3-phosphatase [Actinomycetota bacterium]|nr:phosphatidylinositol-3-phosphatase [Actinomycetota bacterium]
MKAIALWLGLVVACVAAACGTSTSTVGAQAGASPCRAAARPTTYRHVIWIWMENHRRSQVIGSRAAPYISTLATGCASAADYRSVGSPSLPNYLGATSGSTQGVRDDGSPSSHPLSADNLFRQVRSAGGTAQTFAEAMPAPCTLVTRGRYAVKHNPAAYYVGADDRAACRRDNVPLGTLTSGAFADALDHDRLATFTFVEPDLCNDTHDCAVAVGDRWVSSWMARITASPAYQSGSTAVFLMWDEPTPMPFVAVAPSIAPGTVIGPAIDHYAILRLTEDLLGLPVHLARAVEAPDIRFL